MRFTYPAILYFLFLIPLIILLHFLYKKKKSLKISSLLLWEEILNESKKSYYLRMLFNNINLLLQIMIFTAFIFSMADPYVFGKPQSGTNDIILIIDNSASMKTIENEGPRYENARAKALELVNSLHSSSRVMIIKAETRPELLTGYTQDRAKLKSIISGYKPSDEVGNIEDALTMAASLTDRKKRVRIILISDGAFEMTGTKFRELDFEYIGVGSSGDNTGITMFNIRKPLSNPDEYEIMITIENFSSNPVSPTIRIRVDNNIIAEEQILLKEDTAETRIFFYKGLIIGRLTAELDISDNFKTDNSAYAVLSNQKTTNVLLASPGNFFLENLLYVHPNTNTTQKTDYNESEKYDIVILDRIPAGILPPGNFLLINTIPDDGPIKLTGIISNPEIFSSNKTHPILNSLDLDTVKIKESMSIKLSENTASISECHESPLIVSWQLDKTKAVFIGFDILKSDLPLKTAFPVLIGNIITFLNPGNTSSSSRQVQAGSPYKIPFQEDESINITYPDGSNELLKLTAETSFFTNTSQTGFYTINSERASEFAVNLMSSTESDIVPRFTVNSPISRESRQAEASGKEQKPLWYIFIIAAFIFLIPEWYFRVQKW